MRAAERSNVMSHSYRARRARPTPTFVKHEPRTAGRMAIRGHRRVGPHQSRRAELRRATR